MKIRNKLFSSCHDFSKSFVGISFYGAKTTDGNYEKINHSNIYLLFNLLWCQKRFCKIMQCKETDFSRSIEMYHFGELSNVQDKIFK